MFYPLRFSLINTGSFVSFPLFLILLIILKSQSLIFKLSSYDNVQQEMFENNFVEVAMNHKKFMIFELVKFLKN